jgi:hypothetical protein
MASIVPPAGTLLWVEVGESGVPDWCFLKVEDDGAHIVRLRILGHNLQEDRCLNRREALACADVFTRRSP